MSAALEFSLGLATGGFLRAIEEASTSVKGFVGGLLGIEAITERVKQAIEKGAGLEALHKRTGESVSSLYELQEGFKAAGLSGDDVAGTLMHMQRAIGGVNEMGERTPDIFRRLGLNIETLQQENAPQQINQIVSALRQLNTTGAASAATSIFGRMDASNILQIVNSTKEFGEGMEHATAEARNWQRVSAAFEALEVSMRQLKNLSSGFFAGLAEGLVPALQRGLNTLQAWEGTLINMGQSIGRFAGALIEAFREGKITELIGLSLKTGFEIGFAALPGLIEKVGYLLLKTFESPLTFLQAGFTWLEEKVMEWMGKMFAALEKLPGGKKLFGGMQGLKGMEADSFKDIYADRQEAGVKFFSDKIGLGTINDDADARLADAKKQMGKIAQPWLDMTNGLANRGGANALPASAQTNKPGQGAALEQSKSNYKFEGTSLEKMGFVMGGQNPGIDYQRRTAMATEKTAEGIRLFNADAQKLAQFVAAKL